MKRLTTSALFLVLVLALANISFAQDLTISTNTTWQPGTYAYTNVSITNNAILTFNGAVTLNAKNLTIESGSSISADGSGFPSEQGPGKGYNRSGGGYGGKGAVSCWGSSYGGPTYGSAIAPIELGSGGGLPGDASGGGAVKLVISGVFTNDGEISANGKDGRGGGSGGSIYIITNAFLGSGSISANGGSGYVPNYSYNCDGGGGGGRIAIYYQSSSFSGTTQAKGGSGGSWNGKPGEDGTVVFVDTQNNILYTGHSFKFQENDSPFNFTKVILDNSQVISQGSVNLTAGQFILKSSSLVLGDASSINASSISLENNSSLDLNDICNINTSNPFVLNGSSLILNGAQSLSVPSLILENSTVTLSGKELLALDNVTLNNKSLLTSLSQGKIDLIVNDLIVDSTSSISVDGAGYPSGQGPGKGNNKGGGGYGGKGAASCWGNSYGGPSYGSAIVPIDLGSGGGVQGGGAIKLTVLDAFTLNGSVTANGKDGNGGGSGGSIYIITKDLSGSGSMIANGGSGYIPSYPNNCDGGGGGGRIAVYYQTSTFAGITQAKGGSGGSWNGKPGEDGTIILQNSLADVPMASFILLEKSSTNSNLSETLSSQPVTLNNVTITGSLTGSLNFNNLEFVTITSGSFKDKGLIKGDLAATLEGVSYNATLKGMLYPVTKENKLYLKGEVEGELNGIFEGELTETTAGSGVFNKLQATLKLNRLKTETISATLNLEGTLTYQSSYAFTSNLYLYQGNYEGSAFGSYTGPLNAVLTQLRLTSENEYKGEGFSIISYNSTLGSSNAYAYNQTNSPGIITLSGLFNSPLLGKLTATLDENKTPKTLSGTIERLDLGEVPVPDLKVTVWGPSRVSPGQTINYIIEYRNDGLKAATEAIVYFYPDFLVNYKSASQGAYYNNYVHRVVWNLGALPAKSIGYLSIQADVPWGLPAHLFLENRAYILDIILHSTEENGVSNGMGFDSQDSNGNKDLGEFVHDNNAKWYPLYDKTNFITGALEARLASKDISTDRNGVGVTSPISGYRPEWIAFSAGATTYVTQAKNKRITGDVLYIISPQLVTQDDVKAAKAQFKKVIVLQGDDLIPDNYRLGPIKYEIEKRIIGKTDLISIAKGDSVIEDLIRKIEQAEGQGKLFSQIELYPKETGNRAEIIWEGGVSTGFLTTYNIEPMEGVDVITIPGIKHEEWIPVLNDFRDKYKRKPTIEDVDKLKDVLKEFRKKKTGTFPQENVPAHDPNIKYGPEGNVSPGQRLDYTIEYENEGEGIAYGVYFADTLDEDLDDSTLQVGPVIDVKTGTQLTLPGTYNFQTRTITWLVGEVAPKQGGYAELSVNVKKDPPSGAEIINFATIYFPSVPEITRTNGIVNKVVTITDNIPPITTASASPLPNSNNWNNTEVTITLSATDIESGSGLAKTEYSFDSLNWTIYTEPLTITTEGTTKVYYRSIDTAGNTEQVKSRELKIDKTSPVITTITSPQPNSFGWNNTDVIITFTATDVLSGIASVSEPQTVTTEGKNQNIGGQATDLAGNTISTSIILNIDKNKPEITLELKPIKVSEQEEEKEHRDSKEDKDKYDKKVNKDTKENKNKDWDNDDDKDEEAGNWYQLTYSGQDSLSGLKSITCGLNLPSITGFKQELKISNELKVEIEPQDQELEIKALNPNDILKQLQSGSFSLDNNQTLQLKLKNHESEWKIKQKYQGIEIKSPSIIFKAMAYDYADNTNTKELKFNNTPRED